MHLLVQWEQQKPEIDVFVQNMKIKIRSEEITGSMASKTVVSSLRQNRTPEIACVTIRSSIKQST